MLPPVAVRIRPVQNPSVRGDIVKLLFWIRNGVSVEDVDQKLGEYIQLESYMKTFVYRCDYQSKKVWRVSELYTGLGFAIGDTKRKAIDDAKVRISVEGRKQFLRAIVLAVRKVGKFPKPIG